MLIATLSVFFFLFFVLPTVMLLALWSASGVGKYISIFFLLSGLYDALMLWRLAERGRHCPSQGEPIPRDNYDSSVPSTYKPKTNLSKAHLSHPPPFFGLSDSGPLYPAAMITTGPGTR